MTPRLRAVLTVACAVLLGLPGLWLAAAGGGPVESPGGRLLTSALYFLAAGSLVGLVAGDGRRAWLAAIVAWGPAVLGATGALLALEPGPGRAGLGLALVYLTLPAGLALAGGRLALHLFRPAAPERSAKRSPERPPERSPERPRSRS